MTDNVPKPGQLPTSADVAKMLSSVSWYFKRTNVLDIPTHLTEKLSLTLAEVCRNYTK